MVYFKYSELADTYHVSPKTVYNWIEGARQGKNDLVLNEEKGKSYVAKTSSNMAIMESLANYNKRYRNKIHHKIATPTLAFYDLYSRKQILDIITNLDTHREIPRQYNYFDGGAANWDKFAQHMWEENSPNLLRSTIELLHANLGAIDLLLENRDRVNVVDIGPGNGVPVKELLEHLLELGKLHRYIAVDISESMLRIAEDNIRKWFGDKVKFEGYVKDITYERFDDLLVDDMLAKDADKTINLALMLGATPMNFQSPYDIMKVICKSLGHDDLLIYTDKPDTEAERASFEVNADPDPGASALSSKYSFIFDLLNIDESLYDVELGYNEKNRVRYIRVRLKVALTIQFKFKNGQRNVNLDKGETILLWRVWHQTALEIISEFEKTGFMLLQSSMTKDRQYLLTISGVDTKLDAGS